MEAGGSPTPRGPALPWAGAGLGELCDVRVPPPGLGPLSPGDWCPAGYAAHLISLKAAAKQREGLRFGHEQRPAPKAGRGFLPHGEYCPLLLCTTTGPWLRVRV